MHIVLRSRMYTFDPFTAEYSDTLDVSETNDFAKGRNNVPRTNSNTWRIWKPYHGKKKCNKYFKRVRRYIERS